jgi:elongation factor 2
MHASQLTAQPRLLEPVYLVEIQVRIFLGCVSCLSAALTLSRLSLLCLPSFAFLYERLSLPHSRLPQTSQSVTGGVYYVINRRRGQVIAEELRPGTNIVNMKAYLPVAESFRFAEELRGATSGKAFPQCVFDHWQVREALLLLLLPTTPTPCSPARNLTPTQLVPGDPLEAGSKANQIALATRKRKGLKQLEIPPLSSCLDKL